MIAVASAVVAQRDHSVQVCREGHAIVDVSLRADLTHAVRSLESMRDGVLVAPAQTRGSNTTAQTRGSNTTDS